MNFQYALVDESYKYEYGIFEKSIGKGVLRQTHQEIELISAKNDWAACQLLIKSDDDFTLSISRRPYFSPRGPLTNIRLQVMIEDLPESAISVFPVGLVEDDDRICKSDILLENETVFVEKLRVQPVWIEVDVPSNAQARTYKGEIRIYGHRMFEREVLEKTLGFTIEVLDFDMGTPKNNRFNLDLWLHMSNIARKHEVALWSDAHFEVLEHYIRSLADLGQKSIMAIVSEIPWSGQNCYKVVNYLSDLFEYSMIGVNRVISGEYRYDFSVLERYISLCFQYGIDQEIDVLGLLNIWTSADDGYGSPAGDYPDAIRVRYCDEADGCFKYMENGDDIQSYIEALEDFFINNGLIDKVRITADEPGDISVYLKRVNELKRIAPRMKIKTIIGHPEFLRNLACFQGDSMDLVVHLDAASSDWDAWRKSEKQISGLRAFYVCCGAQKPNTFISSPLLECRLIGLVAAFMEFDGFLRWNYTAWPENPRERISFKFPIWQAGDTNFVYPSKNGRPLLTLRYKNLKRGIEDFELIQRVKETCLDFDIILARVKEKLFRCRDISQFNPNQKKKSEELYSLDYCDYTEARRILIEALVR